MRFPDFVQSWRELLFGDLRQGFRRDKDHADEGKGDDHADETGGVPSRDLCQRHAG
jgi:hypothetical protein